MAKNSGTLITAPIRPNDSDDNIPVAFSNEVEGGSHSYATLAEAQLIPSSRRRWGMKITVYNDPISSNNGTYKLLYNRINTNILDNENIEKEDTSFVPVYVNEDLHVSESTDYKLVEQFSFYSNERSLSSIKILYTTLYPSENTYIKVIASTGEILLAETIIPTFEFDPGTNLYTRKYLSEREVQEVTYALGTPSSDCRVSILAKPETDIYFKNIIIR